VVGVAVIKNNIVSGIELLVISSFFFLGESLIVSPTGRIIKKLGSSPDIVIVDIDLEELEQSKQNYHYVDLS